MEWISIREQLPNEEQHVLCCLANGDMAHIEQAVYRPGADASWCSLHDEGLAWRSEIFSHWMPLPEGPARTSAG